MTGIFEFEDQEDCFPEPDPELLIPDGDNSLFPDNEDQFALKDGVLLGAMVAGIAFEEDQDKKVMKKKMNGNLP
jgi:hypothetical protein